MDDRNGGPDAPYSYDEAIEEAERYAPSGRPRLPQDREKKRVRTGFAFPYKIMTIAGIALILVGAGIQWGKRR